MLARAPPAVNEAARRSLLPHRSIGYPGPRTHCPPRKAAKVVERRKRTTVGQDPSLLDYLDRGAEAFDSALTREYYLNRSGQKEDLDLEPIFRRHVRLFSRRTAQALRDADTEDPRLPALREFVVLGRLEKAARALTEEVSRRETVDAATWEGEQVPYRALSPLISNEPDGGRRHQLDRLRVELTAGQNPLREERWDTLHATARSLGYENYAALCDTLGSLRLKDLARQMSAFIWSSEKAYRSRLEDYLRGLGVDPGLAERSDLAYLFRSPQFDVFFSRGQLIDTLLATLRDLGIDAKHQGNVHLDTEPRPRKSPRAFCAPIRIPGEVMLVINPHGGQDDYRALFHEAGHAQHFAHTDRGLTYAERGLGDNSVTEAYAFTLEHLVYNPAWLERHLDIADPSRYLYLARFHKLYMLRRYAAKLLYEMELHGGENPRAKSKRYADLLTASLGVRHSAEDYLFDVDDGFYCARYLRAWILEAQVRGRLEREFGERWFENRQAGAYLRTLWSWGQSHPADELAQQLGYEGLDATALIRELLPESRADGAPNGAAESNQRTIDHSS
jgi:hypothetical protein